MEEKTGIWDECFMAISISGQGARKVHQERNKPVHSSIPFSCCRSENVSRNGQEGMLCLSLLWDGVFCSVISLRSHQNCVSWQGCSMFVLILSKSLFHCVLLSISHQSVLYPPAYWSVCCTLFFASFFFSHSIRQSVPLHSSHPHIAYSLQIPTHTLTPY